MRTLWRGGRVHTTAVRDASAVLLDGGVVAWVGDEDSAEAAAAQRDADAVVDLDGALVTPAFVDAHVHLTGTGLALTGLDLAGVTSGTDLLAVVAARAAALPAGATVLGSGWDESAWSPPDRSGPAVPGADELERAAGGRPVYLARVDAHSALVSAGVLARVEASRVGWAASGWLTRDAHHVAREATLGAMTPLDRRVAQDAALAHFAARGVGCVHECAGPTISSAHDLRDALAARTGAVPEVIGYWAELAADGGVGHALDLGAVGAAGDLFCDGSIGSHTAAFADPYRDADTAGHTYLDLAAVVDHVVACTEAGLQAGFHAIGDLAVSQVVDAVRLAGERLGRARVASAGHRIEHAEAVVDPDALAAAGLLASVQPAFDATWGGPDGMYAARLGAGRAAGLNRFAALAAAGVPLAFGSDTPVCGVDPWAAVRAAVHPRHGGPGLSPRAAFAAHTRGGWRAARRDGDGSGTVTPGAPATLAVWAAGSLGVDAPDERVSRWSTDPRAALPGLPDLAPDAELPRCLVTLVAGRVAHDAGGLDLPADLVS